MTCALTGHRDLPPGFDRNAVYDALEELIRGGYETFYCGMARGFDLAALAVLVDLRKKYDFRIVACIPYAEQAKLFSAEEKRVYSDLLARCDEKVVLSETYYQGCTLQRNRYMVDRADLVLAYCVRDKGGTAYTVNYAKKKHVEVKFLS